MSKRMSRSGLLSTLDSTIQRMLTLMGASYLMLKTSKQKQLSCYVRPIFPNLLEFMFPGLLFFYKYVNL